MLLCHGERISDINIANVYPPPPAKVDVICVSPLICKADRKLISGCNFVAPLKSISELKIVYFKLQIKNTAIFSVGARRGTRYRAGVHERLFEVHEI